MHNSCLDKIKFLFRIKHTLLTKSYSRHQCKSFSLDATLPKHPDDLLPDDQCFVNQFSVDRNIVSYKIMTIRKCIISDSLVLHEKPVVKFIRITSINNFNRCALNYQQIPWQHRGSQ